MNKKNITKLLCINGVIASLYFVLTAFTQAIAFGSVQFRIAEALCILPALIPQATLGITIGCLLANLFSPYGIWDIIIGTVITFVAALITTKIKKVYLIPLPTALLNALGLPLIWILTGSDYAYFFNAATILIGEAVVLYALGIPLFYITKHKLLPILHLNK